MTVATEASAKSPCTSVCKMDERSGWCEGCLRTLDEIAAWSSMANDEKQAVWAALALRRIVPPVSPGPAVHEPAGPPQGRIPECAQHAGCLMSTQVA